MLTWIKFDIKISADSWVGTKTILDSLQYKCWLGSGVEFGTKSCFMQFALTGLASCNNFVHASIWHEFFRENSIFSVF